MVREQNFFKVFENHIFNTIRTFMPAQIISYDKERMVADVQPSFLLSSDEGGNSKGVKMGMLQDVPVTNFRLECEEKVWTGNGNDDESVTKIYTPVYEQGDMVMLAICDRNTDNMQPGSFLPNSTKKFSVNDAVVIGGWMLK